MGSETEALPASAASVAVATIDNHEVVREGVAARLQREPDLDVVASVRSVEDYRAAAVDRPADVVVLDLWLDEGDATDEIPDLAATGVKVLVCTTEQRPVRLRKAVENGATGVVLKRDPLEKLITGIRHSAAGEFSCSSSLAHALLTAEGLVVELSPRQLEILEAVARGLDHRAVAASVGVSEAVVRTHLVRVRDKFRALGVEPGNAHDLTRLATEQGHLGRPLA